MSGAQITPARLAELRKAAEHHRDDYWADPRDYIAAADPALVLALLDAAEERDAYRKAKQENDERFMLERDEARAQLAAAQRALVDVVDVIDACRAEYVNSVPTGVVDVILRNSEPIRAAREAQR